MCSPASSLRQLRLQTAPDPLAKRIFDLLGAAAALLLLWWARLWRLAGEAALAMSPASECVDATTTGCCCAMRLADICFLDENLTFDFFFGIGIPAAIMARRSA